MTYTDNLESAVIWRKWAAISLIGAVLEQKVWIKTGSSLYPNLYIFLVGSAGTGKSRSINAAASFAREIPELYLGFTSSSMASLVDTLVEAKRTLIFLPDPAVEYHSLYLLSDELSAFIHEFDPALIGGLTTFYDCGPYSQTRRTNNIKIKMERPQLSILSGATPSNLMKLVPDYAWEQGFTSRIIMVYSNDRPLIDTFNTPNKPKPVEMIHDLKHIATLDGQMGWTEEFARAMHNWKLLGFDPVPQHPKLASYCARRFSHVIKLSMVASVDRGDDRMLRTADFNRAMGWLLEAEQAMPDIFRSGMVNADSKVMDEILHFVKTRGTIKESQLIRFATELVPAYNVMNVLRVMEDGGMLKSGVEEKTGYKVFKVL